MLQSTISNEGRTYTNLLPVIVSSGAYQLPEGTTHWGLRSVHRDPETGARYSRLGFPYPEPGHWVTAPGPIAPGNRSACPRAEGDGLCLATNDIDLAQVDSDGEALLWSSAPIWKAISSSGIPANHLLLVAYSRSDILGGDYTRGKLRVRRMFIVADIDGLALITDHGTGAEVAGLNLQIEPTWSGGYLDQALMAGATLAEYTAAHRDRIELSAYASARAAGLTDHEIRALQPSQLLFLLSLIEAGASIEQGQAALAANVDPDWYEEALDANIDHADILDAHKRAGYRWDDQQKYIYILGRIHAVNHSRSCRAATIRIHARLYNAVRQAGASDRRVRAAHKAGIDLYTYARLLRAKTTHRQIFTALDANIPIKPYVYNRCNGVSDETIHAAHRAGENLWYLSAPAASDEPPF
ncbi:hypothetical protein GCM10009733_020260 [Nonomuraea maheshkhaliensis]|uniref:Uncharacterized protein n=1 Tax=Nonomuraea maheshkhaliensis TaxID=419590 RepID=A0ABN2EZP6_9ACTN